MRTVATFRSSAFNVSEERDYFINPGCFGDDLAEWMILRLKDSGCPSCSEPGQEDFGWYFNFQTPDGEHCCVLGYRPSDSPAEACWVAWLERSAGLIGSMLGRRRRVAASAVRAVHGVLSAAVEIDDLRWHDRRAFDEGREASGARTPDE